MGWTLYSGSVYQLAFTYSVIVGITENGTALTAVTSVGAVTAGKYYMDRSAGYLYLRTLDSTNPNSKFEACTFKLFFCNKPVRAPWDLGTGYDIDWSGDLNSTSEFGVELDNRFQFGLALEGEGTIELRNNRAFWQSRYDKLTFENQRVFIYSWNRQLPITEAKLIYRGRIQGKTWTPDTITFQLKDFLNELRAPVALSDMEDVTDAKLPDALLHAKQRLLYGYIYGHRPTNYDQVLSGYPWPGGNATFLNGSTTVTGDVSVPYSFRLTMTPDDELSLEGTSVTATVKSIELVDSLTLSEAWTGSGGTGTLLVKPKGGRRWMNRLFLLAGHALREPVTTVATAGDYQQFTLTDATDFLPGDTVIIGSETQTILRTFGNVVRLNGPLNSAPAVGATVTRPAVTNVYLNERLLTVTRDYTYSAADGTLTLDTEAEFNVAPVVSISGTLAFTNGVSSRTVNGTSTFFKSELKPGDWITQPGTSDWFEIKNIDSDTSLQLRNVSTISYSGAATAKKPEYYEEGKTVLSCDVLGATEDGTTSGTFIKDGPSIVKDLLTRAGLASFLATSSFTTAAAVAPYRLGIAIPDKYSDAEAPLYRDVIARVNQSIFGALVQNEDFQLEYTTLSPRIPVSHTKFTKVDILSFQIQSDAERVVSAVNVGYLHKEYEPVSKKESQSISTKTSKTGTYLVQTDKEFDTDSLLVTSRDASIFASRWAFLLGVASSIVQIQTKLQGARLQVTDKVEVEHEKFYERPGSSDTRKIAGIQYLKKSFGTVTIELEDLANAFSRCCIISAGGTANYSNSTEAQRARYGFITDSYGMMGNDPDTFGKNVIW